MNLTARPACEGLAVEGCLCLSAPTADVISPVAAPDVAMRWSERMLDRCPAVTHHPAVMALWESAEPSVCVLMEGTV